MTTYHVTGTTQENGSPAANLIIVYRADRDSMVDFGTELGRAYADGLGVFEVTWLDYAGYIFVIAMDPTTGTKYDSKIIDWLYGAVV